MTRRPNTIVGLTLRLLGQHPRRALAVAAGALGGLAILGVAAGSSEAPPEIRSETPPRPWLAPFYGEELIADDEYVYWTEARDREYDDRPVRISRAAVRRRRHEGGEVETIFDFERDDIYCFPGALRFMHGVPAWHCRRPVLDGHGRADPSRYMHLRDGALEEVPAPWAQPGAIAASGSEVTVIASRAPRYLLHFSAVSGELRRGVDLPDSFGYFGVELAGVTDDSVIGTTRDDEGPLVWSAPRYGEGPATVLFRPPAGDDLVEVLADERATFVSWQEHWDRCHLARIENGRAREIHDATSPILGLLRVRDDLHFHQLDEIRRLHLPSSRTHIVLRGARPGWGRRAMAVGGGWIYWRDDAGLHRHEIRHSSPL